jgi:hypothetical protein
VLRINNIASGPAFSIWLLLRTAGTFHIRPATAPTFESPSFRASGRGLNTAAVVHWNTVYLDRAVLHLGDQGADVPDDLLAHVAPLGWEHIGLTGDEVWTQVNPRCPRFGRYATFPARAATRLLGQGAAMV